MGPELILTSQELYFRIKNLEEKKKNIESGI